MAAARNPGWVWDDLQPYFRRSEDHCEGESELHGAGVEWRGERQRLSWGILRAVQECAKEFGIIPRDDFNDGSNEWSGFFQVNQRSGLRWNTARGFLRPALRRGNLRVVTHAFIRRITLEGLRATGVEGLADNAPSTRAPRPRSSLRPGPSTAQRSLNCRGSGRPRALPRLASPSSRTWPMSVKTCRTTSRSERSTR